MPIRCCWYFLTPPPRLFQHGDCSLGLFLPGDWFLRDSFLEAVLLPDRYEGSTENFWDSQATCTPTELEPTRTWWQAVPCFVGSWDQFGEKYNKHYLTQVWESRAVLSAPENEWNFHASKYTLDYKVFWICLVLGTLWHEQKNTAIHFLLRKIYQWHVAFSHTRFLIWEKELVCGDGQEDMQPPDP